MSRFANIRRGSFAAKPNPGDGTRPGLIVTAAARRHAMLTQADAVLGVLPGPGEALHGLMTGRYDLMLLLTAVLAKLGTARAVRIATLSYNGRNLAEMASLMDGHAATRLTLLCSAFFRDHNKELWEETQEEFRSRGQRAAAARSHCKVITIELDTGRKLSLEGSANLRTNSNREQFCLIDDPGLHDWHAGWIDELVSAHEGEDGEGKGK